MVLTYLLEDMLFFYSPLLYPVLLLLLSGNRAPITNLPPPVQSARMQVRVLTVGKGSDAELDLKRDGKIN